MASTLGYGSRGDEVKKLQNALNDAGYILDVDGIYGDKTKNAVTQYQQAKGLSVDGIAGSQTWGSLLGSSSGGATAPTTQKTPMGTEYDPSKIGGAQADLNAIEGSQPQFAPSKEYTDALAALKQHQSTQPGEYVSPFADRLNALYEKVMGRGDFNYDFNADALYHQHRDRYAQEGQRAMQDTMANAAALTGGYGNSYAATAGQQAYNQYMQAANDVIPQLEQRAFERWQAEGDDVLQKLNLIRDMDATEYGRHQDTKDEYFEMLQHLTGAAGDQYDRDYQQYRDALDMFLANRDYYADKAAAEAANKGGSSGGGSSKKTSGSSGGSGSYSSTSANKVIDSTNYISKSGDPKLTVSEAQAELDSIAEKEGKEAAQNEFSYLIKNGLIIGNANKLKEKWGVPNE